jgi:SAM-dependent methyltransferase
MALDRSTTHAVMAIPNDAEMTAQMQIVTLKRHLRELSDGVVQSYHTISAPNFAKSFGHEPQNIDEVGQALENNPVYRSWSNLNKTSQVMMWESVGTTIGRELPRISANASDLRRQKPAGGSLILDANIPRPDDALIVDIHGQPGGYMLDAGEDDIRAGAFYENGGNVYTFGTGTAAKDSKAAAVIDFYHRLTGGQTAPKRILDIGCSAGSATVPYRHEFPDAEVHGIDIGPGLLRYAHARAEALGYQVHFRQMNAVAMSYDSASFDLVVSHNLMHEVSTANLRKIFTETYRVLAPGGIAIFQDVPVRYAGKPLIEQFLASWQTVHNNEPHWDAFATCDVVSLMAEAGFAPNNIREESLTRTGGPGVWYAVAGFKP